VPAEVLLRIVRAEDERRWELSDLGQLLADERAAVRRRAALAAGRIGDEGAVGPLSALLRRDIDEGVRAAAAFALGEVESEAGAEALLETLRLSRAPAVRARAVEALGKVAAALGEPQAERRRLLGAALLGALAAEQRKPKPDRATVLLGLTAALRARPEGAGRAVAASLASADARVRADAANALARLRSKESLEQLRGMLMGDPDAVVSQDLDEVVDYGIHAIVPLVRVLVGGAVHLVHSLRGVLARRLLLAQVLALPGVDAEVV